MGALGRPLRRTEDRRLITGAGRYVDDLEPPGTLHAVFVRCREAHAVLGAIDTEAARTSPGVVGVFSASDLGLDRAMPNTHPNPLILHNRQARPLASQEVCHVGEPVAWWWRPPAGPPSTPPNWSRSRRSRFPRWRRWSRLSTAALLSTAMVTRISWRRCTQPLGTPTRPSAGRPTSPGCGSVSTAVPPPSWRHVGCWPTSKRAAET